MIINTRNESNLKVISNRLTKTVDYTDVLEFTIPLSDEILLDDIIQVKSDVINQKYRVHKVDVKNGIQNVYCKHIFFDTEKIVIPSIQKTEGVTLEYVASHINLYLRNNGYPFKVDSNIRRIADVEIDDTSLYNIIFSDKGILNQYNCKVIWNDYSIKLVDTIPARNTEILFHEKKNAVDLQKSIDSKDVVTKLYVKGKHKKVDTPESREEEARARREKFDARNNSIKNSQLEKAQEIYNRRKQALTNSISNQRDTHNRILERQAEAEREWQSGISRPRRTREEIHREKLERQNISNSNRVERINNSQINRNSAIENDNNKRLERIRNSELKRIQKFEESERNRELRRQAKDNGEQYFRVVVTSPIANQYPRVYEASITVEDPSIVDTDSLAIYCQENFFTEDDTRDIPIDTFTFKPTQDNYDINLHDIARVNYSAMGISKNLPCCKIEYDAYNNKYISIEFGELKYNARKGFLTQAIRNSESKTNAKISSMEGEFGFLWRLMEEKVREELEAADLTFDDRFEEETKGIEEAIHEAELKSIENQGEIAKQIEDEKQGILENVRETTADFNRKLEESKRELSNASGRGVNAEVREALERYKRDATIEANNLFLEAKSEARAIKDKVDNLKVGGRNYILNSKGEHGHKWINLSSDFIRDANIHRNITVSVTVKGDNLSARGRSIYGIVFCFVLSDGKEKWFEAWKRGTESTTDILIKDTWRIPEGVNILRVKHATLSKEIDGDVTFYNPKLELGTIVTPWSLAPEDYMYELEKLDTGYREKFTSLEAKDRELDTFRTDINRTVRGINQNVSTINQKFDASGELLSLKHYKSQVEQKDREISTKLTALEQYKSQDGTRQTTLLSLAERKTNELLNREISRLSDAYVAKNTLAETIRGSERKILESIKVGGTNLLLGTRDFNRHFLTNGDVTAESEKYKGLTVVKHKEKSFKYQYVPVEAGETYTFSFYARGEGQVYSWSALSDKLYRRTPTHKAFTLSSAWKRYKYTFEAQEDGEAACYLYTPTAREDFIYTCGWKLEQGTMATPWSPAPEDGEAFFNDRLATYRQEVDSSLTELRGIATDGKSLATRIEADLRGVTSQVSTLDGKLNAYKTEREQTDRSIRDSISSIGRKFDSSGELISLKTYKSQVEQKDREIRSKVTTLENDTFKKSEVVVTDRSVELGSGKVIDGRKLGSILSVSPEGIQAITDKMVITPYNENLLDIDKRGDFLVDSHPIRASLNYNFPIKNGDEFLVEMIYKETGGVGNPSIVFSYEYSDGTRSLESFILDDINFRYMNSRREGSKTLVISGIPNKIVKKWYIMYKREGTNYRYNFNIISAGLYKKKSASLIVDGSITADQIGSKVIKAGHIAAGAITSEKIDASAIEAKHIKVDNALITKLVAEEALITNLMAKQAFINKLKTIQFDFTKATGDYIQSSNGSMKWDLKNNVFNFRDSAKINFKNFGNALVLENRGFFDGKTTSGGVAFNETTSPSTVSVVVGTSSGPNFDYNGESFTGLRVLQKNYECGLYGSRLIISDTFDNSGDTAWYNRLILNQERQYITLTSRNFHRQDPYGCTLKITPEGIWVSKNGVSKQLI